MTTWNLIGTKQHVLICNGSSCMRKGGEEATQAIRTEISNMGMDEYIHTTRTRCNGRCKDAPVVIVCPEGTWYKQVTPEVGSNIVKQQFTEAEVLKEHVIYNYRNNGLTPQKDSNSIIGISKPGKGEE